MARRVEELMAHEKFKHGTEDDLRKFVRYICESLTKFSTRPFLEELRRGKPCQEHVWVHIEPQKARALQSLFPSQQKLYGSELGTLHLIH